MKNKKKVYFISPNSKDLSIWYTMVDKNKDISQMSNLRVGYNDTYDRRQVVLAPPFFSDDFNKIHRILEERKNTLVAKAYQRVVDIFNKSISESDAKLHDDRESPI